MIKSLKLDITNQCNEACKFCPYHGIGGEISEEGKRIVEISRISLQDIQRIIDELDEYSLEKVKISGSGEATLHHEFVKIIDFLKERELFIKLITNGTTLYRNVETMSNIDDLVISIHGNETTHNNIVQHRKAYQLIIKGLNKMKNFDNEALQKISFTYVITGYNLNEIKDIIELSKNFNIPVNFYFDFTPEKHKKVDTTHLLEKIEHIRKEGFTIYPNLKNDEIIKFFSQPNYIINQFYCDHINNEIDIKANGDVSICRSNVWGNIYKDNLSNIINSNTRKTFIDTIESEIQSGGLGNRCNRCCYQNSHVPYNKQYGK